MHDKMYERWLAQLLRAKWDADAAERAAERKVRLIYGREDHADT